MMKRGASLIWAMVMSTALLFIAVTTATFVIRESQMGIRMDESSRAYAAAESGIDWGKYCIQSLKECQDVVSGATPFFTSSDFYIGGSKYVVRVSKEATETRIESTGTSNGVNRKLEYVLKNLNNLDTVPDEDLSATIQTDGSYVQQFDYWADGTPFANIGLGNNGANPTQSIYLKHTDLLGVPYLYLAAENEVPDPDKIKETGLSLSGIDISTPYALRIRIEYFKDLSAKMTVSKRNFVSGMPEFSCIGSVLVVDVRTFGFSPASFTNYYFNSALTKVTDISKGDGNVKKLMGVSASEAYFDNMAVRGVSQSTTFTLTVSSGSGGTVSGGGVYAGGATPTITAIPDSGSSFVSWSGSPGCSGVASHTITMDATKTCTASFSIAASWIKGRVGSVLENRFVYYQNLASKAMWKKTATDCAGPQCTTDGPVAETYSGYTNKKVLVADNENDYSNYPARDACKAIGGRLPTIAELMEMNANQSAYNNNFGTWYLYWSGVEGNMTDAYAVYFRDAGSVISRSKDNFNSIRCVK